MAGSSLVNVARFNATTGGLTDWTYSSTVTGYQSPITAGVVTGFQYSYRAESIVSGVITDWENGLGNCTITAGVPTFARTTVLASSTGSKVNFAVAPQVALVALAGDLIGGSQIVSAVNLNPATTTSTTDVMMGMGSSVAITPARSTRIKASVAGVVVNGVATAGVVFSSRFGTGTAPINGAAVTGTLIGSLKFITVAANNQAMSFANVGVVTGLTVGTAYWFDLAVRSITTGTSQVENVDFTLEEV